MGFFEILKIHFISDLSKDPYNAVHTQRIGEVDGGHSAQPYVSTGMKRTLLLVLSLSIS